MWVPSFMKITVTLQWDATQFAVIKRWMDRSDDAAKAVEVTSGLKASQTGLQDAISANTPKT